MTKQQKTSLAAQREAWLTKATKMIATKWAKLGVTVPADVALSCGFPGGGSVFRRIGECWPRGRSGKGVNQIFISPVLEATKMVLDVLGHELLHAADDCKSGHGAGFTKLSVMVGYSGGKHSAATSVAAKEFIALMSVRLGAYPHGAVKLVKKEKKSSNGLHKFFCEEHGDVLYSTSKMVDVHGVPKCRECGEEMALHDRTDKKEVKTI